MEEALVSLFAAEGSPRWFRLKRYYAVNYEYYDMNMHAHSEMEIMYIAHGRCRVLYQTDDKLREAVLQEGTYIFLDGMVSHRLVVDKACPCRILNLEIALVSAQLDDWRQMGIILESAVFGAFLRNGCPVFILRDDGTLHHIITTLQEQQSAEEPGEKQLLTDLLLAQLWTVIAHQSQTPENGAASLIYIKRALRYIEAHYDGPLSVAEVANATGISVSYLQRLFFQEMGCTLIEFINHKRVEKAKLLLEISRLTVTEIAVSVGFNSRQYLTRAFTREAGCSPGVYRKTKGNSSVYQGFPHPLL